ncbi:MAG: hypothetical protein QXN16_00660 [Candidatus Micrarchaeaceae archaeon]
MGGLESALGLGLGATILAALGATAIKAIGDITQNANDKTKKRLRA